MDALQTFHHFAYGSNMSTSRLRARCPSAKVKGVGFVRGRTMRFHKRGMDGTGKANAFATHDNDDILWGVVYETLLSEKVELDRCESLGVGYEHATVEVQVESQTITTFLYQAITDRIDDSLVPADWYHAHVINGAIEHGLPQEYHAMITRVTAQPPQPVNVGTRRMP
ncbi:AIG2 family protein [Rhodopirellula maiorica SM1]|uniref:AIG2 family protein n=2 Tax=Novipirellula TaxID=2795426 RepID=M5RGA3_9BACT|nr:AIG2 family protein [Rhodopirellula maiorica SM1]